MLQPVLIPGGFPIYFGNSYSPNRTYSYSGTSPFSTPWLNSIPNIPADVTGIALHDGRIYCSANGFMGDGGLAILDIATNSVTLKTTADGLASGEVYSVAVDSSGNILVGTGNGLSVWNGSSFTNYSSGLLNNNIRYITTATDGSAYLSHSVNGTGMSYAFLSNGSYNISSLVAFQDSQWGPVSIDNYVYAVSNYNNITQEYGIIYRFNPDTQVIEQKSPYNFYGFAFCRSVLASNGKVFAVGVDKYDSQSSLFISTDNGENYTRYGLSQYVNNEMLIIDDSGVIYIFSDDGNLILFNTNTNTIESSINRSSIDPINYANIRYGVTTAAVPAPPVSPTNVKVVGTKIVGDVTVDPTTVDVKYNNAAVPVGSVLRDTVTNYKYLKITGGIRDYDVIPATPDAAWGWTTGTDAWENLQDA